MLRLGLFEVSLAVIEEFIEVGPYLVAPVVLGSIGANNIDVQLTFKFDLLPLRTYGFESHLPRFLLFVLSV